MTGETDYYEILKSGISRTQPDSFEARGAVYDRLWQIVSDQLYANQSSEEEIAAERATFLRAVQRLEFGGGLPMPEPDSLAAGPRDHAVVYESSLVDKHAVPREQPRLRRSVEATRARSSKPRRRMFWRIATVMVSACVMLLVGGIAFALIAIRSDPTAAQRWGHPNDPDAWQARMMRVLVSIDNLIERGRATIAPTTTTSPSPTDVQRAVLYEESASSATGTTFSGQAVWRHQAESKSASTAALSINVEIPQKNLLLEITMRRAPAGGAASHFVEFGFFGAKRFPSDAVENVLGILMKNDELSRGIELKGQIVKVHQGMFLMGLSGTDADVASNMTLLKERGWLDIPIVLNGGGRAILAIEKGASGEKALSQVLSNWGRG
jgi:hypothetical protein